MAMVIVQRIIRSSGESSCGSMQCSGGREPADPMVVPSLFVGAAVLATATAAGAISRLQKHHYDDPPPPQPPPPRMPPPPSPEEEEEE